MFWLYAYVIGIFALYVFISILDRKQLRYDGFFKFFFEPFKLVAALVWPLSLVAGVYAYWAINKIDKFKKDGDSLNRHRTTLLSFLEELDVISFETFDEVSDIYIDKHKAAVKELEKKYKFN